MSPRERNSRRRVLVLTGIFPNRKAPTWGVHVFQNVRALAQYADVRVVATVPWVPRGMVRGRYNAYAGVPAHDDWEGISVAYPRFFVVPRVARFLHGFGLFASIWPAVRREVRAFHPDVLLAYFAYPYGFAAVLLGRLLGLPVVISCRGSDVYQMTKPPLQGRAIKWALAQCRRVFVMSEGMRTTVLSWGIDPGRVEVVSNGVDAGRFHPMDRNIARATLGIPATEKVIVCVSRLSHEKGIDVLVDAIGILAASNLRLYVVGDGAERGTLETRARNARSVERIVFLGTRPHEEIANWLAAADLAVLPSRSEGMPNAVLEALACGRPVVATAVGGTPELLDNDSLGILVEPDDATALAHALQSALARPWDENVIAASVASRTWDAIGERAARLLAFESGHNVPPGLRATPEKGSWTTRTH